MKAEIKTKVGMSGTTYHAFFNGQFVGRFFSINEAATAIARFAIANLREDKP